MTVGITGGMGCGKSAVTAMLVTAGFECLDSDKIIREVVLLTPEVIQAVRGRLGATVLRPDGSIDRGALAARVFARDEDRLWLEDLTHPRLFQHWREELQAKPEHKWVLEVPLLFEKQLENWFDFIVCVASSSAQQLARLEQRGIPRPLAEQRISKQLPLAQKIELSDIVLWNDGSISFLQSQVEAMIADLTKRAGRSP